MTAQGNAEALRERQLPQPEPTSWREAIAMAQSATTPYGFEFGATPQRPRQLPVTQLPKAKQPKSPPRRGRQPTRRRERRVQHGRPVRGVRPAPGHGAQGEWALAMSNSLSASMMAQATGA